jgi:hypothetical protein
MRGQPDRAEIQEPACAVFEPQLANAVIPGLQHRREQQQTDCQ